MTQNNLILTFLLLTLLLSNFAFPYHYNFTSKDSISQIKEILHPPSFHTQSITSSQNSALYDEQLGTTFTQDFSFLSYNVTAVAQTDTSSGYGPAYLLNGLSDTGYWYQVGLAWNWDPSVPEGRGFSMVYEVWDPKGNSIFPSNGGGGLLSFSGRVNQGDIVELTISFTLNNVTMSAFDINTHSNASVSYSSQGAKKFTGLTGGTANSKGYFTGLMTEWYHGKPFYSNVNTVIYSQNFAPLKSAWMWADEFSCSDIYCTNTTVLFSDHTQSPVVYTNPLSFQEFKSHGATLYSNAFTFVTGNLTIEGQVRVTVSYSISGSPYGSHPPYFSFYSNGIKHNVTMSTTPVTYLVDVNSSWIVSGILSGSNSTDRWITNMQTRGVFTYSIAILFVYYYQHLVNFSFSYIGQSFSAKPEVLYYSYGTPRQSQAGTEVWVDDGSTYTYEPRLNISSDEMLIAREPSGTVMSHGTITVNYYFVLHVAFQSFSIDESSPIISEVNASFLGEQTSIRTPGETWVDYGSKFEFQRIIPSSMDKRYVAVSNVNGTILKPGSQVAAYKIQYLVSFTFNAEGGYPDKGPSVRFESFGKNVTTHANSTTWVDYLSAYRFDPIIGGSKGERWVALNPVSGLILSSRIILVIYQHQYYVNFYVKGNGNISRASGWYNYTQIIKVDATSSRGWSFISWSGSFKSTSPSIIVVVNFPLNLTAEFYPILVIHSGEGGYVEYSYGNNSGTVPEATEREIAIKSGQTIKLRAQPSSFFDAFSQWQGNFSSVEDTVTLTVSSPSEIKADFGYNYFNIAFVTVGVILALLVGWRITSRVIYKARNKNNINT
jgi:hypothetical protein